MKHVLPFLFLLLGACSSSDPDVASTSAGSGGAAGDDGLPGLFGGRGGSGAVTLVDGGGAAGSAGEGGSGGSGGSGAGGGPAEDAGADAQAEDGGADAGADSSVSPDGGFVDPECEGLVLPEPGCRCAGFEGLAYFFCPGLLDVNGAHASCGSVEGFVLIGSNDTVVSYPEKVEFVQGLSGEDVWLGGIGHMSEPPYDSFCYVLPQTGTVRQPTPCTEQHAYVCEEKNY